MSIEIKNELENILRESDIEGLIELGAPSDEYNSEAEKIYNAINENGLENLLEKIYYIWSESFVLEVQELEKRKEGLDKVYELIIAL